MRQLEVLFERASEFPLLLVGCTQQINEGEAREYEKHNEEDIVLVEMLDAPEIIDLHVEDVSDRRLRCI